MKVTDVGFLGHLVSPLRANGSAIESVFSSLKYIAGGHLSSANYSTTVGSLLTQKETHINPHAEKEYRTNVLYTLQKMNS